MRLFSALAALVSALAAPAWAGDHLPRTDCDTTAVAGQIVDEIHVWPYTDSPTICTVEIRPKAIGIFPARPITSSGR